MQLNGRLPAEVVHRILRMTFGRFRRCYEIGLVKNPTLTGQVVMRFSIDKQGSIYSVVDGGSSLPDRAVVQCILGAIKVLAFPAPESGIVTVVYPITLGPAASSVVATP